MRQSIYKKPLGSFCVVQLCLGMSSALKYVIYSGKLHRRKLIFFFFCYEYKLHVASWSGREACVHQASQAWNAWPEPMKALWVLLQSLCVLVSSNPVVSERHCFPGDVPHLRFLSSFYFLFHLYAWASRNKSSRDFVGKLPFRTEWAHMSMNHLVSRRYCSLWVICHLLPLQSSCLFFHLDFWDLGEGLWWKVHSGLSAP